MTEPTEYKFLTSDESDDGFPPVALALTAGEDGLPYLAVALAAPEEDTMVVTTANITLIEGSRLLASLATMLTRGQELHNELLPRGLHERMEIIKLYSDMCLSDLKNSEEG